MTDVFISYKREERDRCVAAYNALLDLHLTVWFDAHIGPGTSFDREIEREVHSAKSVLVLWSTLACDSDWIRAEARTGKRNDRLVSVRLDDCVPPLEFTSVQTVDLFGSEIFNHTPEWARVVERIGQLCGRNGLGSFVRCEQAADLDMWSDWIDNNPDEPLVPRAQRYLDSLKMNLVSPEPTITEEQPVASENNRTEIEAPPVSVPNTDEVSRQEVSGQELDGKSETAVVSDDISESKTGLFSSKAKKFLSDNQKSMIATLVPLAIVAGYFLWPDSDVTNPPISEDSAVAVSLISKLDCDAAADAGEKIICSDPELMKGNEQVFLQYKESLDAATGKDQELLVQKWNLFLKQQDQCTTEKCLTELFAGELLGQTTTSEEDEVEEEGKQDAVNPKPVGDSSKWIRTSDYPSESLQRREDGTTTVSLAINEAGRVSNCSVGRSSGHARLDTMTCRLLRLRGKFEPARNEDGEAVEGTYKTRMVWKLPPPERPVVVEPKPVLPSCNTGPYIVFFDWDQSDITPQAATVLDNAVSNYANCGTARVRLAGHADREMSSSYSVRMSQRRNSSVRAYLEGRGIAGGVISSQAFGESQPRVATADGVREIQNRRVEVTFSP